MRWYADNSELNGLRGSSIPDILLFGGIAVTPLDEKPMRDAIESVKAKMGHRRAPVKWNFKDLKSTYKKGGIEDLYSEFLAKSKDWRLEVARSVVKFDFKILVAVVEGHSIAKKTLKGCKPDLARYAFSNGLMRFALHVMEEKPKRALIILDWPDKGDSKPFDSEYVSAYNDGKTRERSVTYHSGPLERLGFSDCACYVNMHHSTLLQFADLVLGATREVVECSIGKKASGFGVDFAKILADKYRGYPDHIIGRGISVASRRAEFRSAVKSYVDKELKL